MYGETSKWVILFLLAKFILVYTIIGGDQGVDAACVGNAADDCVADFYSIPCPHRRETHCCVSCPDIPVKPIPQAPPLSASLPPLEIQIEAPVDSPVEIIPAEVPTTPPVESPVDDAGPPPSTTEPCPLPSDAPPFVNWISCLERTIPVPERNLASCGQLDSLLSQVEIAQESMAWPGREHSESDNAPWLTTAAFANKCPDKLSSIKLKTVTFKEERGCRGVLSARVVLEFTVTPVTITASSSCQTTNSVSLPPNGVILVEEVFVLETRQPTIAELESHELLTTDRNLQCLADLPTQGHEQYMNKTLLVGPDCYGGSVPVTYRLRLLEEDTLPNEQCVDRKKITYAWETFHPVTGEVCPGETLQVDFTIEDTTEPHFIESLPIGEDQVYFLQCYADLVNFRLEWQDNCNKTRQVAQAVTTVVHNTSTDGTCTNSAIASIVFSAKDSCGNEARKTVNFMIRGSTPPRPVQPIHASNPKKCRRHIPPSSTVDAELACKPGIHTFPLARRTYSFDRSIAQEVDENGLLCEHKLLVSDTYQLCDGCSVCVNVTHHFPVNDDEPPLWVSPNLPPKQMLYQCMSEIVPFRSKNGNTVLLARDDCDQIDIEVIGAEEVGRSSAHKNPAFPDCTDDARITRYWETCDLCGNCAKYTSISDVMDTTAPELVNHFNELSHFCLSKSEVHLNRFVCFPDITLKMATLVKGDNCGHEVYLDFISARSFRCTNPEDPASCTQLLSSFTSTTSQVDQYTPQYNRYYGHNDTLCVAEQASLLHMIVFEVSDRCGNPSEVPIDIFTPKRSTDDAHYDPQHPTHPCDSRIVLALPTSNFVIQETAFGSIYLANRLDPRIIKKASSPHPTVRTTSANLSVKTRTSSGSSLRMITRLELFTKLTFVAIVVGMLAMLILR